MSIRFASTLLQPTLLEIDFVSFHELNSFQVAAPLPSFEAKGFVHRLELLCVVGPPTSFEAEGLIYWLEHQCIMVLLPSLRRGSSLGLAWNNLITQRGA